MTSKQSQKTLDGSTSLQANGDINITTGIQPSQMTEIMAEIRKQVGSFIAISNETVTVRLDDFEKRMFEKFSPNGEGKINSFADPDFQYQVRQAQQTFVRSENQDVHENLIDLIAKRSQCDKRDRLSLTLNDAIDKSSLLTSEEFAALSLCFTMKHVRLVPKLPDFVSRIQFGNHFKPFLKDVSRDVTSYQYLESHGLASLQPLVSKTFDQIMEICRFSFPRHTNVENILAIGGHQLLVTLLNSGMFTSLNLSKESVVLPVCGPDSKFDAGLSVIKDPEAKKAIKNLANDLTRSKDEAYNFVKEAFPEIDELKEIWNNTPLNRLSLTTTGIAIGYTNAKRLSAFDAPINIWIR